MFTLVPARDSRVLQREKGRLVKLMTCCLSQNKSVEAAAGELIQSSNSQNTQTHPILEAQALVAPFFRLFRQILNSSSFVLGQKEWMAVPPASPLTKPSIWLNQ